MKLIYAVNECNISLHFLGVGDVNMYKMTWKEDTFYPTNDKMNLGEIRHKFVYQFLMQDSRNRLPCTYFYVVLSM